MNLTSIGGLEYKFFFVLSHIKSNFNPFQKSNPSSNTKGGRVHEAKPKGIQHVPPPSYTFSSTLPVPASNILYQSRAWSLTRRGFVALGMLPQVPGGLILASTLNSRNSPETVVQAFSLLFWCKSPVKILSHRHIKNMFYTQKT